MWETFLDRAGTHIQNGAHWGTNYWSEESDQCLAGICLYYLTSYSENNRNGKLYIRTGSPHFQEHVPTLERGQGELVDLNELDIWEYHQYWWCTHVLLFLVGKQLVSKKWRTEIPKWAETPPLIELMQDLPQFGLSLRGQREPVHSRVLVYSKYGD